jgi:hypothetical protein
MIYQDQKQYQIQKFKILYYKKKIIKKLQFNESIDK